MMAISAVTPGKFLVLFNMVIFVIFEAFFNNFIIVVTLGFLNDVCGCGTNSLCIIFFDFFDIVISELLDLIKLEFLFLVQDFFELFLFMVLMLTLLFNSILEFGIALLRLG